MIWATKMNQAKCIEKPNKVFLKLI